MGADSHASLAGWFEWLNLFNAELSPKSSFGGDRDPRRWGEEVRIIIPNATLPLPE